MTREKININKKSIWHKEQVHKHTHDRLSDVWLAVYNIYPDCCSNVLLVPAYNPGAKKKIFLGTESRDLTLFHCNSNRRKTKRLRCLPGKAFIQLTLAIYWPKERTTKCRSLHENGYLICSCAQKFTHSHHGSVMVIWHFELGWNDCSGYMCNNSKTKTRTGCRGFSVFQIFFTPRGVKSLQRIKYV